MEEVSYIIALMGILVLLVSGAAWWNVARRQQLQPIAGRLEQDTRGANSAAIALVAAFGLSLVAAILAIFSWMF